jgi:hypothetical protein
MSRRAFRPVVGGALAAALGAATFECTTNEYHITNIVAADEGGEGGVDVDAAPVPAATFRPCTNEHPIDVAGQPTGFVACNGGSWHRTRPVACPAGGPWPSHTCRHPGGACITDSDCPDSGPHAFCDPESCQCYRGCVVDFDCAPDAICECFVDGGGGGGPFFSPSGKCVSATCIDDGHCPKGSLCTSVSTGVGCLSSATSRTYRCQTTADGCLDDYPDCVIDASAGPRTCVTDDAGGRFCGPLVESCP